MIELTIKKGRPLLNNVLVTSNKYTKEDLEEMYSGIIPSGMENQLKPYQTVVAISPRLRDVPFKVGDMVLINIDRYGVTKHKKNSIASSIDEVYDGYIKYEVPLIEMDGKEYLKLGDNDIEFIIDDWVFNTSRKAPIIQKLPSDIIVPGKGRIKMDKN